VLCRRDDEYYQGMHLYPALRAATAEEIARRLDEFSKNSQAHTLAAATGKTWLEDEVLRPAVARIAAIIRDASES